MNPEQIWEAFRSKSEIEGGYSSWYFCDNEKDANELADLVLTGKKSATASVYELFERENEEIPKHGDHSVITDWSGKARCIIKTTQVDLVPFREVTAEFAFKEGEGDCSLEYWRKAHWEFFTREMEPFGLTPRESMLVVCEEFELVFK